MRQYDGSISFFRGNFPLFLRTFLLSNMCRFLGLKNMTWKPVWWLLFPDPLGNDEASDNGIVGVNDIPYANKGKI